MITNKRKIAVGAVWLAMLCGAAYGTSLTIPYSFSPATTIYSAQVNANNTAIANVINGGIDNSNIAASAGIVLSKLGLNPGGSAFNQSTTGNNTWCSGLTTDVVPRVAQTTDKGECFGPGASGALDVALKRTATKTLQLNDAGGSPGPATLDMFAGTINMNGGTITNVASISGPNVAYAGLQGLRIGISATPGIPADGTSSTIFIEPFVNGTIGLWNGTGWVASDLSSGLSIAIPATTNTGYDVYVDYNSGTPQLSLTAWGGINTPPTRGTQNGVIIANGAANKRLVGCFQTGGTSGATADQPGQRFVWNLNNQIPRGFFAQVPTASWTSAANFTWRPANTSNTTNGQGRVAFFIGVANQTAAFQYTQPWNSTTSSTSSFPDWQTAIGIDSTTVPSSAVSGFTGGSSSSLNAGSTNICIHNPASLTAGNHFAQMLEQQPNTNPAFIIYGNGTPGDALTGTILQ